MSGAALLAVAAMAMPAPAPAPAAGATVDIPGRYYVPADVQVLVGEPVTWRNLDMAAHTVTADGVHAGGFDSGRIPPGGTFTTSFAEPGDHPYICTIHRQMRGTVHVSALGLTGPEKPLAPGDTAELHALVPPGTALVSLERVGGARPGVVATAVPDAGGRASFAVGADVPARYRARAGALTSAVVAVRVAPRVRAVAHRHGVRVTVRASIEPPQPGATVALLRYSRERFTYIPVRRVRSATGDRVRFTVRSRRRVALAVAVTRAPGGWSPARSPHVVAPSLRR